jgi:hypothetical protein
MRLEATLALALLAALSLVGCPKGGGTSTSGGSDCFRDVSGDLATANKRLEKGKPEEARLYVEALAGCASAWERQDYLDVAGRVAEELGDLNGSWKAAKAALDLAVRNGDGEAAGRWDSWLRVFSERYVWLEVFSDERERPPIRYAGAVVDDATLRQLEDVAQGRAVRSARGDEGFWVFPGRYKVGSIVHTLEAGQTFRLSYRKEGVVP